MELNEEASKISTTAFNFSIIVLSFSLVQIRYYGLIHSTKMSTCHELYIIYKYDDYYARQMRFSYPHERFGGDLTIGGDGCPSTTAYQ